MTTYITIFGANKHININLHGYILGGKCKLIAQNQTLERVNRGKFSLETTSSANRIDCSQDISRLLIKMQHQITGPINSAQRGRQCSGDR
jgi:hypothetical protein